MGRFKDIWTPKSYVIVFIDHVKGTNEYGALKVDARTQPDGDTAKRFESLDEIIRFYGKNKAYHFHVSGGAVLTRSISYHSNYLEDLIVSGNTDDFYFTSFNDETTVVSSFFRKDLIKNERDYLEEKGIMLTGISSGEVPLFALLESDGAIEADHHISLRSGMITDFRRNENRNPEKALWEGTNVNKRQLIALSLLADKGTLVSTGYEERTAVQANLVAKRKFQVFGVLVIGSILLSLLGNYFYLNHLNQDIAQLETDLSVSNDNLALLERLEQEKLRKEQLVLSAGISSDKFLSFYLDEIGEEVPESIKLQSLELFPLTGKLKDKQKMEVDQHRIEITGTTKNNEILDDWIERMDRFSWVKGIEVLNYLKNDNGEADFKLKIQLSE